MRALVIIALAVVATAAALVSAEEQVADFTVVSYTTKDCTGTARTSQYNVGCGSSTSTKYNYTTGTSTSRTYSYGYICKYTAGNKSGDRAMQVEWTASDCKTISSIETTYNASGLCVVSSSGSYTATCGSAGAVAAFLVAALAAVASMML